MTTEIKEKMSKQQELQELLEGRKQKLAEAKQELNKLGLEFTRQQQRWARLSIDSDSGSGPAKKKLDELRAKYQKVEEKAAAYQATYDKTLQDPKVKELTEAAINEAIKELENMNKEKQGLINTLEERKKEITEIGFKVLRIVDEIKKKETDTRKLHKDFFGKRGILALPRSGKLYAEMPFFHEVKQEWRKENKKKPRPAQANLYVQRGGPLV